MGTWLSLIWECSFSQTPFRFSDECYGNGCFPRHILGVYGDKNVALRLRSAAYIKSVWEVTVQQVR